MIFKSLRYLKLYELTIMGLKTFSSKCPLLPPTVTATWFPITWAATMVTASHWVGFTFPGCGRERTRLPMKRKKKTKTRIKLVLPSFTKSHSTEDVL